MVASPENPEMFWIISDFLKNVHKYPDSGQRVGPIFSYLSVRHNFSWLTTKDFSHDGFLHEDQAQWLGRADGA